MDVKHVGDKSASDHRTETMATTSPVLPSWSKDPTRKQCWLPGPQAQHTHAFGPSSACMQGSSTDTSSTVDMIGGAAKVSVSSAWALFCPASAGISSALVDKVGLLRLHA